HVAVRSALQACREAAAARPISCCPLARSCPISRPRGGSIPGGNMADAHAIVIDRKDRDIRAEAEDPGGTARRILCVFPRYEPSLGSFEYAYDITGSLRAFMPPQGLLVIAASLPSGWQVRFIDENVDPAKPEDFAWADAVFVSGMHVQRNRMIDI